MKKLLFFLFMLIGFFSKSQSKITWGPIKNTVAPNHFRPEKSFGFPIYADTAALNTAIANGEMLDSTGVVAFVRSPQGLYTRQLGPYAKYWSLYGTGATPPAGSSRDIQINDAGSMGVLSGFAITSAGHYVAPYGGLNLRMGADASGFTITNTTNKSAYISGRHYTTSEEDVMLMQYQSLNGSNVLQLGYGSSLTNAITELRIGGSSNATTVTGGEWARFNTTGLYIGTGANASSRLHLAAGSTTIAPLQFTAGTNNTTAAAGRMEYDGTNLYFTPTGTTRKRLPIINNATPSNGQIPIGNGTDFTTANITSSGGTITVTNGSGTIDLAIPTTTLTSNSYTPTLTNVTNVSSSSVNGFLYIRTGNVISFSLILTVTPTAGSSSTQIDFSIPVASNFSASTDLIATGSAIGSAGVVAISNGDVSNDRGHIEFTSTNTSAHTITITGHYKII